MLTKIVVSQPLFCSSAVHGEWWPTLLEKACAVYLGSYERVARCSVDQLLHLLTGGFCTRMDMVSLLYCNYYLCCNDFLVN
jgi:hypothetical protein